MNTRQLRDLGQSLWLDNITRDLLDSGTLQRYIDEWSISGLTSNPTIFDEAIGGSAAYDRAIRDGAHGAQSDEVLFTELALDDLRRAADLFQPVFAATGGVDGWVSMEVSPLLVDDTAGTIDAATRIFAQAGRPNLFVKIPGTAAGVAAIEESIFNGVPVNVTLLFSREQYLAAAEAYLRGIERRLDAGRDPRVASVASLFVSRWDKATHDSVPKELRNRLGIAVGGITYRAYRELLGSPRWQRLAGLGARPQRLLWASTGTKDPDASDCLYVEALAAPDTIDTMPEKTLHAFADHGKVTRVMDTDGVTAAATLAQFGKAGIDIDALARRLQIEGAQSFSKSWRQLLERVAAKRAAIARQSRSA
ncbi:MAG TPA: transaldolase [Steroidobacteraceae bacterium]|nr:transaldolase [Steroidobacteraceae bacterium]